MAPPVERIMLGGEQVMARQLSEPNHHSEILLEQAFLRLKRVIPSIWRQLQTTEHLQLMATRPSIEG